MARFLAKGTRLSAPCFGVILLRAFSGQVLDNGAEPGAPAERSKIFKALLGLSKSTGLYPQCLHLSHQLRKRDEPVAEGAFGEVFRGSVGNREVAIKVFRVYETPNVTKFKKVGIFDGCRLPFIHAGFLQRAWVEAILWCQLYHANVLPCYGIHHVPNQSSRIGLVSPWMGRGNVVEYLRANPATKRPLLVSTPPIIFRRYAHKILKALGYRFRNIVPPREQYRARRPQGGEVIQLYSLGPSADEIHRELPLTFPIFSMSRQTFSCPSQAGHASQTLVCRESQAPHR